MKRLLFLLLLSSAAFAQAPYALLPWPRACFWDTNGQPLAGGMVATFAAGTSTPLATYSDNSGLFLNVNPTPLDSTGCAPIWIAAAFYKITVSDSGGNQIYTVDNVSDLGARATGSFVQLTPPLAALQTVVGPLAAAYFQGTTNHFTSPNVRVSLLDPLTTLDTATNPPNVATTNPAVAGQVYTIPDPGTPTASFILSPNNTTNTLDCTQPGITCKRTAYIYFEGAGCNNTTSAMGWDTFGGNSPSPLCISGTNIQKGVLAFPSAATPIQTATCVAAAAGTCVVAMPLALTAHNLPVISCAVDGSKIVSGVTDGTNAYTKATSVANGATDVEIWYFNGDAATASGNVTVTLSGAANSACRWREYQGLLVAAMLDKTATGTGTSTAPATGATVGTSQNVELILSAVASPSNPTVAGANGWTEHGAVSQSTNVTVDSEAKIQQTTTTQIGSFTLGSSQAWAAAVATFKANVGGTVTAQRGFALPQFYLSTSPVDVNLKWQAPLTATGVITANVGAAVVCTVDGNTDDPAFLAAVTATPAVNASAPNIITTTPLNALTSTGCASGSLMHLQIQRLRYSTTDTFEGFLQVNGAALDFGISR